MRNMSHMTTTQLDGTTVQTLARRITPIAHAHGITTPIFRVSTTGERRVRRLAEGVAIVEVPVGNRRVDQLLADMIEGVVAAAGLDERRAPALRADIWHDAVAHPASSAA